VLGSVINGKTSGSIDLDMAVV